MTESHPTVPVAPSRRVRPSVGRRGVPIRRPRLVHYTDAEWDAVKTAAQLAGKPARRFVRDASLGTLRPVPPVMANAPLIRELGRAGTALAQLATMARMSGALPHAATLEAALAELLALVRRIGQTVPEPALHDQRPE
jgi:hypothetical protein